MSNFDTFKSMIMENFKKKLGNNLENNNLVIS